MYTFSAHISVAVGATVKDFKIMIRTDHHLVKRHIGLVLIKLIGILEKVFNVIVTILLGVSSLVSTNLALSWIVFHLLWLVLRFHTVYLRINSSLLILFTLLLSSPPKFLFLNLLWFHGITILWSLHV